jgi:hypothetical protein
MRLIFTSVNYYINSFVLRRKSFSNKFNPIDKKAPPKNYSSQIPKIHYRYLTSLSDGNSIMIRENLITSLCYHISEFMLRELIRTILWKIIPRNLRFSTS